LSKCLINFSSAYDDSKTLQKSGAESLYGGALGKWKNRRRGRPANMYSKDMIFFYVINPTLQTFYVLVIVFCYANMAKNH
jgi:hypothetical protein